MSEASCGLVWERTRKGRQSSPHSLEIEHCSSLPGLHPLSPVQGRRQTHTQMQCCLNTEREAGLCATYCTLCLSQSQRHTPICQVIRTHLGACHSDEWVEGVSFLLTCLFLPLTVYCFLFFSNILIIIGSFARREEKYTICIFRAASTEGVRVTVFHRWP